MNVRRQLIDISAQVVPVPGLPPFYMTFKGTKYRFTQVHLHSGVDNSEGSDHTLFGKRFPLEAHLVYRQEKYGTLRNAQNYKHGVAVIAVFFEVRNNIFGKILDRYFSDCSDWSV